MSTKRIVYGHLLLAGVCVLSIPAYAHKPLQNDGTHSSAETALSVDEPDVSQVVYHILPDGATQLWISIETTDSTNQFVQLGVPFIGSLDGYRPVLAVVGPGRRVKKLDRGVSLCVSRQ